MFQEHQRIKTKFSFTWSGKVNPFYTWSGGKTNSALYVEYIYKKNWVRRCLFIGASGSFLAKTLKPNLQQKSNDPFRVFRLPLEFWRRKNSFNFIPLNKPNSFEMRKIKAKEISVDLCSCLWIKQNKILDILWKVFHTLILIVISDVCLANNMNRWLVPNSFCKVSNEVR